LSRNTKLYFEAHAHDYTRDPEFYSRIAKEIKKVMPVDRTLSLLDVGCGNGDFIKKLREEGVKADYFATDISSEMITIARSNTSSQKINFFVADGFSMPVKSDVKFDIIHIDCVLHHLIEHGRRESMNLVKKMIEILATLLSSNGVLIVEEVYYDSYLIQTITSFAVFYGLKIINFLNLDLSRFNKQMRPGLEVNFLHERQLFRLLEKYGSTYILNILPWQIPKMYRFALLRKWGFITFVVR
jgi:SAM-dependent methyltransferase